MKSDPSSLTPSPAVGAQDRVAAAVRAVSPEPWLEPAGVVAVLADGRFQAWVQGLERLDPQPGEQIAVRGGGRAPWALALLAHLVGPTGGVWVADAVGVLGWWRRRRGWGLPGWVRFGPAPEPVDGLWLLDGSGEAPVRPRAGRVVGAARCERGEAPLAVGWRRRQAPHE